MATRVQVVRKANARCILIFQPAALMQAALLAASTEKTSPRGNLNDLEWIRNRSLMRFQGIRSYTKVQRKVPWGQNLRFLPIVSYSSFIYIYAFLYKKKKWKKKKGKKNLKYLSVFKYFDAHSEVYHAIRLDLSRVPRVHSTLRRRVYRDLQEMPTCDFHRGKLWLLRAYCNLINYITQRDAFKYNADERILPPVSAVR